MLQYVYYFIESRILVSQDKSAGFTKIFFRTSSYESLALYEFEMNLRVFPIDCSQNLKAYKCSFASFHSQ